MTERLLKVQDLTRALNISRPLAYKLIREERIRFLRIGTAVRIPESAVAEYIEANSVGGV